MHRLYLYQSICQWKLCELISDIYDLDSNLMGLMISVLGEVQVTKQGLVSAIVGLYSLFIKKKSCVSNVESD